LNFFGRIIFVQFKQILRLAAQSQFAGTAMAIRHSDGSPAQRRLSGTAAAIRHSGGYPAQRRLSGTAVAIRHSDGFTVMRLHRYDMRVVSIFTLIYPHLLKTDSLFSCVF